jgi:hypothetical protein
MPSLVIALASVLLIDIQYIAPVDLHLMQDNSEETDRCYLYI